VRRHRRSTAREDRRGFRDPLPSRIRRRGPRRIELAEEDLDTVFYTGSALDLGEAAAETLALALDPFPRSPNAAEVLKKAGVISEEEAGPFGALAALKDKLSKN
jgi:hypothetical protein